MSINEMQIGIGLPANIPGVQGKQLFEWAKKADGGPFSSMSLVDRLVYDNYDPLIAFAAAAGATHRIRLMTTVLLAPLHAVLIMRWGQRRKRAEGTTCITIMELSGAR